MNLTRHPSVTDALRGTGIKSEGYETLVSTMTKLLKVVNKNSEEQYTDILPEQRLLAAEKVAERVAEYDDMVLSGADSSDRREVRGRLLASMPEFTTRRLAID